MSVRRLINNDYSFGSGRFDIITGLDECLQKCRTSLMQLRGEWFLNYTDGVGWGDVLGHKRDSKALEILIKKSLLSIKGVESISNLIIDIDNRFADISLTVNTNFGSGQISQSLNVLEILSNDKVN